MDRFVRLGAIVLLLALGILTTRFAVGLTYAANREYTLMTSFNVPFGIVVGVVVALCVMGVQKLRGKRAAPLRTVLITVPIVLVACLTAAWLGDQDHDEWVQAQDSFAPHSTTIA